MKALVWFRHDLRVFDNTALTEACRNNDSVQAVYILNYQQWKKHNLSPHRIKMTLLRVRSLRQELRSIGIALSIIETPLFSQVPSALKKLVKENDINSLYAHREYAADEVDRDHCVEQLCRQLQINSHFYCGATIIPPGIIRTQQDTPYRIFTPFKKTWLQKLHLYQKAPLPIPTVKKKTTIPTSDILKNYIEKYKDIDISRYNTSRDAGLDKLDHFAQQKLFNYQTDRDFASQDGTSHLSPYLNIGMVSPQQCLHRIMSETQGDIDSSAGASTWLSELIWREFYINIIHDFPDISRGKPFKTKTNAIAWSKDKKHFKAWCEGKTGFPIVDAAMHQLNTTGWMHNRLRMVTATFLSKYLLIDWRWGESYFMTHLIDGNFAANNGGWQWCASTGADAAPYFRLLSPVRQAERFDPDATFIKQMIPALAHLPAKTIFKPGHPDMISTGYPAPIVDLKSAREKCLAAFSAT